MEKGVYERILITGGGGMLARALIGALQKRGLAPVAVNHATLDISQDASAIIEGVFKHKPTLILNCAAFTKVDACEDPDQQKLALATNGFGAGYLAAAANTLRAKFVHFSTDF